MAQYSGCLPNRVSSVLVLQLCCFLPDMFRAHAKILLQNCYHKVALVMLLQNCRNADEAVLAADMCFQKCWQKARWQWMLNRSVGWCLATGWAKVLDGLSQQELEAVMFEVTSLQRVLWFDGGPCLREPLELSRLIFEMWPNVVIALCINAWPNVSFCIRPWLGE